MKQSRERSSAPLLDLGVVAIKKVTFWIPITTVGLLTGPT